MPNLNKLWRVRKPWKTPKRYLKHEEPKTEPENEPQNFSVPEGYVEKDAACAYICAAFLGGMATMLIALKILGVF